MKRIDTEVLQNEHNGCLMVWESEDGTRRYERSNAWSELARIMLSKYQNKVNWIHRVTKTCNYYGSYTITFYEDNGKRHFQYIA